MPLRISPTITIPDEALTERFIRASGPGGQHVNKTSSAVELRCDSRRIDLPNRACARLRRLAGRRMTEDGVIVLQAERHRSQNRNREDARERLIELIREAAAPPPPPRRPTKPSLGAKRRRLNAKQRRGAIKAGRGRVSDDD